MFGLAPGIIIRLVLGLLLLLPATAHGFKVSRTPFSFTLPENHNRVNTVFWSDAYQAPDLPSSQDWILVLERLR